MVADVPFADLAARATGLLGKLYARKGAGAPQLAVCATGGAAQGA